MRDTVLLITGASTGIGAALGRVATGRGASVALVARRAEVLRAAVASCGPTAHPVVGDMTRRDDVRRAIQETIARFGHVDVLVNNVGRGITRAPSELTDADIDEMMLVNVKSALYGIQEILPHFRERGRGHVINVSSMLGRIPFAMPRSAYGAAKHFLNALTANLRAEVQATHPGIHISLVSPGVVRTEFGVNALHGGIDSRQLGDSQSAEEVAEVIADLIVHPRPDVYTRTGARDRVLTYYAGNGTDP
jgi:NADP-dependent 3-hydroxy acid dehydrogenase YdfG